MNNLLTNREHSQLIQKIMGQQLAYQAIPAAIFDSLIKDAIPAIEPFQTIIWHGKYYQFYRSSWPVDQLDIPVIIFSCQLGQLVEHFALQSLNINKNHNH
jgi:hypothetical protein